MPVPGSGFYAEGVEDLFVGQGRIMNLRNSRFPFDNFDVLQ